MIYLFFKDVYDNISNKLSWKHSKSIESCWMGCRFVSWNFQRHWIFRKYIFAFKIFICQSSMLLLFFFLNNNNNFNFNFNFVFFYKNDASKYLLFNDQITFVHFQSIPLHWDCPFEQNIPLFIVLTTVQEPIRNFSITSITFSSSDHTTFDLFIGIFFSFSSSKLPFLIFHF